MDTFLTLAVGFGSALAGAVAGFVGANHLENEAMNRRRIGMVRAILGELRMNGSGVLQLLSFDQRGGIEYQSETWRQANFELAQFLPNGLYLNLVHIYGTLPLVQSQSEIIESHRFPDSVAEIAKSTVDRWLVQINEAITALLETPQGNAFRADWERLPSLDLATGNRVASEAANEVLAEVKGRAGNKTP
jgi:hypothetical protein